MLMTFSELFMTIKSVFRSAAKEREYEYDHVTIFEGLKPLAGSPALHKVKSLSGGECTV
jgi:hypothetical protein